MYGKPRMSDCLWRNMFGHVARIHLAQHRVRPVFGFSKRGNEPLGCIKVFRVTFYLRMPSITRSVYCRIMEVRGAVGKQTVSQFFFLRNCNYSHNDIYIYRGHILHKVQIIFPNAWDAVWRLCKLSPEASGAVHSRCVLEVHLSGDQEDGTRGVLNWTVGKMRSWFTFLSGQTLRIRCFNFFNVCACRCHLWRPSRRIPLAFTA